MQIHATPSRHAQAANMPAMTPFRRLAQRDGSIPQRLIAAI
jgi:hypothetical protein